MSLLPIFLKLTGRRCLVIGAGEIALSKIESLLAADADIHVIALAALSEIQALADAGRLQLNLREFSVEDLEGAFLAIAATDSLEANAAVYRAAEDHGILCNAVDDPPNCDFYFGSVVRRGDLQVAISTAGESPAAAQQLGREIDAQLPQDLGPWLRELGSLRREILDAYPSGEARKHLLHALAQREVCSLPECPSRKLAFPNIHAPETGYTKAP